jgi:signal transduction histidine kinase/HAMP domain-containing protein
MKLSLGVKVSVAFVAMGALICALGFFGLYLVAVAGRQTIATFDGPLMAINYARSASLTFAQMDKEALRGSDAPKPDRAAVSRRLDELSTSFLEDLAVAEERSLSGDERAIIGEIRAAAARWDALRRSPAAADAELEAAAANIIERFDMLIELTVEHSFIARREAISATADFKYTFLGVTALALALAVSITAPLVRRITRPLAAAAAVADRIAGGELDTPIPHGGNDETGTLLRAMTVMRDNIRTMVERETAQRRSAQTRLIDALESSREAMVLVDKDGHVAIANSQFSAYFPAISVAGRAAGAGRINDVLTALAGQQPATETGAQVSTGEFRLDDGRWLRASRSGAQDGGFFLVLSDITGIKEREERLTEAKREAEMASAAKSKFLANVSHELRTPLNAIIGFSELIANQSFGQVNNPRYVEYAGNILESGRHLLAVINSILDFAKSEAGKLQLHREEMDLRHIVESCATIMREQCTAARLTLELSVPQRPLPLWGDQAKLRQILLNLLSNAVKFTEPGGTVSISVSPTAAGWVAVEVADTGIGMKPEDIPTALAPFGQIDSRLARRYEGTGLGLPLTQSLVELHGGTMTIASALGKGTRVTVSLPAGAAQRAARNSRSPRAARLGSAAGGVALRGHATLDDVVAAGAVAVGEVVALGLEDAEPRPILAAGRQDVGVDVAVPPHRELCGMAALRVVARRQLPTDPGLAPADVAAARGEQHQRRQRQALDQAHRGRPLAHGNGRLTSPR